MKTSSEYEQEIADLKRLIERLSKQLVKALSAIAAKHTICYANDVKSAIHSHQKIDTLVDQPPCSSPNYLI